jgi:phosphoribosylformimino-5-aminoimidazole carboxamide ribotide isomerase
VIPAVDLKNGVCVRLRQGDFAQKTVYSDKPVDVAQTFQQAGAQRLHVVDLDGAESGKSANSLVVESLIESLDIPVQLGGGIRSIQQMEEWFGRGVASLIVGTLAILKPQLFVQALKEFGPERCILAVDAKNGKVMVSGWQEEASYSTLDLALNFKPDGLERLLYTDISRDGMFTGPNIRATKELAQSSGLKVTASGGIASQDDLASLRQLESVGVDSVVVGRAFYENRISLEEAFRC